MRHAWCAVAALVWTAACGGEQPPADRPDHEAARAPIVQVEMIGDGRRTAAFAPAAVTIAPGTTVRFINVSGGPHNVVFWPDSIPDGAADVLDAAMPSRMTRLAGPLLLRPNEVYEIAFPADAPRGSYGAYCLPHLALGMTLTITVQ